MIGEMQTTADHTQSKKQEESSYRRVWLVSFVFFLFLAAVTRLLPRPIRRFIFGEDLGRSIAGDARAATARTVPFIYMA